MKKNVNVKYEDEKALRDIESILNKRRGYVFKMPKKGSKVISLMSGGIDTTLVTALLLDKYQLEVFPIHFVRKQPAANPNNMLNSVKYFSRYFTKKYGKQFHEPEILPLEFPCIPVQKGIIKFVDECVDKKTGQKLGIPFQPASYAHNAVDFIYTMKKPIRYQIRTIFAGVLSGNIEYYPYESLTTHRAITLELAVSTRDWSWQYTSLPIEREIGNYMNKIEFMKFCKYLNLPLEYTHTCQRDTKYHCGKCLVCSVRREAFQRSDTFDKTIYENSRCDIVGKIKQRFPALKNIMQRF